MPELVINRSSDFINKYKDIKIMVDGNAIGTIADGETKVFTIPAGEHTIRAKMDWRGSVERKLTVKESGKVTFKLAGFKGQKLTLILLAIAVLSTFVLPRSTEVYIRSGILLVCVGSILGYMSYLYTFGRNKYLTLEQE
ncbi:MAG: hypothetical protein KDC07_08440 [Chitinophagaceae bacterium]|nr:hypothetical protein [Chitinophagaceae bacterium]MCB9045790.1 hypothetical protein [Chitinophagales bacterium]